MCVCVCVCARARAHQCMYHPCTIDIDAVHFQKAPPEMTKMQNSTSGHRCANATMHACIDIAAPMMHILIERLGQVLGWECASTWAPYSILSRSAPWGIYAQGPCLCNSPLDRNIPRDMVLDFQDSLRQHQRTPPLRLQDSTCLLGIGCSHLC